MDPEIEPSERTETAAALAARVAALEAQLQQLTSMKAQPAERRPTSTDITAADGADSDSFRQGSRERLSPFPPAAASERQRRGSSLKPMTAAELTASSAPFLFSMSWGFFIVDLFVHAFVTAMAVLSFFPEYVALATSGAVQIAIVLGISWGIFGGFWNICYAPSAPVLRATAANLLLGGVPLAIWLYVGLGSLIGCILFGLLCVAFVPLTLISGRLYQSCAALPIEALTVGAWLDVFRLYIVVTVPIVANMIRNDGAATILPYIAVWTFAVASAAFTLDLRLAQALRPASKSVAELIISLTALQNFRLFGPAVLGLVDFAITYLVVITDNDAVISEGAFIALVAGLGLSCVWCFLTWLAFFSSWRSLSLLNPFYNVPDMEALHQAQARGLRERLAGLAAMHQLSI